MFLPFFFGFHGIVAGDRCTHDLFIYLYASSPHSYLHSFFFFFTNVYYYLSAFDQEPLYHIRD
jgi:hypothetical protein